MIAARVFVDDYLAFVANDNAPQYTYDALNRADQVLLNGSASGLTLIADYSYDPMSRRTALARGNGATTTYGYTQASRLSALAHNLEGAGTANDANWAFGYNVAGQVISRTLVSVYERSVDPLNQSYARNGLNQYTNVAGTAYAHDARGNLTSDGSRTFTYDLENRLLTGAGSVSGTLVYDPLGRLRSYASGAATTEFLYDGDRLVLEYNASGGALLRRYVHGPGVDEPLIWYEGASAGSGQNWLIADRQGSIIATTNASGTATTYSYDPYGRPNAWAGSRFRYTGQIVLPELQLYHYKARAYDPGIGRFLQTDPVGYEDDLNLYLYVRNDPLNHTDPTGRQAFDSLATRQIYEDEQDVLSGEMTIGEYNDRTAARAEGALTTAPVPAIGATGRVGRLANPLVRAAQRAWFRATQTSAYRAANTGGRHGGFLRQLRNQNDNSVRRGIRSREGVIREHQEKIRNPEQHMTRDDASDPEAVQRAVRDWEGDIRRAEEQNDIARDELRRRATE